MRESWTDERLDDGFGRVDAELRAIRADVASFRIETNERFGKVEERFEKRFDRFEEKLDRWQRLMVSIFSGFAVTLLGIVLTRV